jgi:hypothetical protein
VWHFLPRRQLCCEAMKGQCWQWDSTMMENTVWAVARTAPFGCGILTMVSTSRHTLGMLVRFEMWLSPGTLIFLFSGSLFFLKSRDLCRCHLFCDFFFYYSFCTQLSYSSMSNDFESCLLGVVVTKVTMQSWAHVEVIASFSIGMSPLVVSSASFEAMTVRSASSPTLALFSTHVMRLVLWVYECIRTGSLFLPTCLSWHSSWTFHYLSLWLTVLRCEQVQLKGFRVLLP